MIACLLPGGVGDAVSRAGCPKVYVPNGGTDPEQWGLSPTACITQLQHYLRASCAEPASLDALLNMVIMDSAAGVYEPAPDKKAISALGVEIIDRPLVTDARRPYLDSQRLLEVLLSLV